MPRVNATVLRGDRASVTELVSDDQDEQVPTFADQAAERRHRRGVPADLRPRPGQAG